MSATSTGLLVVGGGISGLTAALEAAETGREVLIVEREWFLGGRVARIGRYFPKMCPPWCGLEINFRRIRSNPLIKCLTGADLLEVRGGPGNYEATVRLRPRYVNGNCTTCGECEKAATTLVDSEFDYGFSQRKAAYLPHPMAFPHRYVLDREVCGAAELEAIKAACPYKAVDPDEAEETVTIKAGAVVAATGWAPYDAADLPLLGGGGVPNVIRNVELERLMHPSGPTSGKVLRPSDGREPKNVIFVQCAGSRDRNHLDFCSAVCCAATLKQADYILENMPETKVEIFYIDIRTPGRLEKFAGRVTGDERVTLTKGKVAEIETADEGRVTVTAEDAVGGGLVCRTAGLVVLATGMKPQGLGAARMAGLVRDEHGFVRGGAVAAGCAGSPMDVAGCAEDATAAALEAMAVSGTPASAEASSTGAGEHHEEASHG